jgi:hypothetical protein
MCVCARTRQCWGVGGKYLVRNIGVVIFVEQFAVWGQQTVTGDGCQLHHHTRATVESAHGAPINHHAMAARSARLHLAPLEEPKASSVPNTRVGTKRSSGSKGKTWIDSTLACLLPRGHG